ncbi:MAG: flagellin [Acidobacteria bacterium]|nr:MAG: flagellin [Acidobacteriota bacterium]
MALSILNNIPSLAAQNQLAITGAGLSKTLFRLSSGSRINSGADDAAGLAIADGLRANISALTQSSRNANDGTGKLQVADGALAQVTNLLNRAVTLATESANGTVSNAQRGALDNEFTAIKAEIDRIGSNTTFNGTAVFSASSVDIFLSDSTTTGTSIVATTTGVVSSLGIGLGANASNTLSAIGNATAGKVVVIGTQTYTFAAAAGAANTVAIGATTADTLANLAAAVNGSAGAGVAYGAGTVANVDASASAGSSTVTFTAKVAGTGGNAIVSTTDDATFGFSNAATFTGGAGSAGLTTAAAAQAALISINNAIQSVAGTRGNLGATINRLQSAVSVINNQSQNLTAAEDGIRAADIAQEVANLTKFSILNQTGISALAQANTTQQSVLSLLR